MTHVILFGGNGYVGSEMVKYWVHQDKNAEFYIISRTSKHSMTHPRVHHLLGDASKYSSIVALLPSQIDFIVNLTGGLDHNHERLIEKNEKPVDTMLQIAQEYQVKAMGFIGATLGPKSFVQIKKQLLTRLQESGIRLEYVEPAVIYGGNRRDMIAKFVPLLKVLGYFCPKYRPIRVEDIAHDFVDKFLCL